MRVDIIQFVGEDDDLLSQFLGGLLTVTFEISDSLSQLNDQSILASEVILQLEVFVLERIESTLVNVAFSVGSLHLLGFFVLQLNQLVQSLVV